MALRDRPCHWGHWVAFFIEMYTYMTSQGISIPISSFPVPQGRREWVDGGEQLWMMSLCLPVWEGSHFSEKNIQKNNNLFK